MHVRCRKSFNELIQESCDLIVAATVEMYNLIRAELLPTPNKSHYVRFWGQGLSSCTHSAHSPKG